MTEMVTISEKEYDRLLLIEAISHANEPSPNYLGEALREYSFVKSNADDYGCYSTFELRPEFVAIDKNSNVGKELLSFLLEQPNDLDTLDRVKRDELYEKDVENVRMFTNGDIDVAWYWDGDGTLLFRFQNRIVINCDCKSSTGWQFP